MSRERERHIRSILGEKRGPSGDGAAVCIYGWSIARSGCCDYAQSTRWDIRIDARPADIRLCACGADEEKRVPLFVYHATANFVSRSKRNEMYVYMRVTL